MQDLKANPFGKAIFSALLLIIAAGCATVPEGLDEIKTIEVVSLLGDELSVRTSGNTLAGTKRTVHPLPPEVDLYLTEQLQALLSPRFETTYTHWPNKPEKKYRLVAGEKSPLRGIHYSAIRDIVDQDLVNNFLSNTSADAVLFVAPTLIEHNYFISDGVKAALGFYSEFEGPGIFRNPTTEAIYMHYGLILIDSQSKEVITSHVAHENSYRYGALPGTTRMTSITLRRSLIGRASRNFTYPPRINEFTEDHMETLVKELNEVTDRTLKPALQRMTLVPKEE